MKNPTIYFMGCPCHIVHNTYMKAAEKFNQDMHNWSQTYLDTLSVPSPVPAGHICFFLDSPGHIMRFVQDPRGHNLCFSPDSSGHNFCFSRDRPPWTQFVFQPRGSYKTRNGTERNGTEPEVIDAQYGRGRRIRDVLMSGHHGTESSSCVLYQPRRRDKHQADSIEPRQAY